MTEKSVAKQEIELLESITEAKKKLDKLQSREKMELGILLTKYKLNEIPRNILENELKNLALKHQLVL